MLDIKITDIGKCMNKMLIGQDFDSWLLQEASITTSSTVSFDGRRVNEFYSSEELEGLETHEDFVSYQAIRPVCLEVIKGKKMPVAFHFVFLMPAAAIQNLLAKSDTNFTLSDVASLSLILRFKDGCLRAMTGSSMKTFSLDKSLDQAFEAYVKSYLDSLEITYEMAE